MPITRGWSKKRCIGTRPWPESSIADKNESMLLSAVNATILLRIMPELRSKYSLIVDGERLGDMKTLNEAVVARECLKEHDFSISEARAILEGEDSFISRFHP